MLAIGMIYFLQEGITINSLKIGNFKVQGLYLKLDNKLTLKLDYLFIPKEKDQVTLGDIDESLKNVKKILNYFEHIELDNVEFTNDNYRIIYSDNVIYISNDEYEVAGTVTLLNGGLNANIPLINIKKYNLTLHGNATYAYDTDRVTFQGGYSITDIYGDISIEIEDNKLSFLLSSEETNSISKLLDMFKIKDNIRVWLDKKVLADRYRLISLRGGGRWVTDGFKLDMDELNAEAKLNDVTINFKKSLKPVKAEYAIIYYNKGRLDFDLKKPFYNKNSIRDSKVSIINIKSKKNIRLLLRLKVNSQYDKEINKILKAYNIAIPVIQKKGRTKADIMLDIDLKKRIGKTEGRLHISKGTINIGSTPLSTYGGEVTFTSNRVALWNVDLYDSWYRGKINGFLNLSTDKARFKVDLKMLRIGDKKGTYFSIGKKKNLTVKMNFKNRLQFEVPALNLKIDERKGGGVNITSSDVSPILPYIKGLPLDISKGNFSITTKDYKTYSFNGNTKWKNSYIYDKTGYISSVPFKGVFRGEKLTLKALDDKFTYDSGKSLIAIKNINIDAKKMTNLYSSSKNKEISKLTVRGKNSIIRYDKYVLLTDSFDLRLKGKNTTFIGNKDGDRVRLEKNGNSIVVHANKIKDKMLRSLINFGGMHGGRYSLELLGNIKGEMKGVIDIKGGAIDSFKAYNDLIALFNTIPALMTLSSPGFSSKGFVIKDGKIEFRIIKNRVIFDNIYLNGKSSTIAGKGTVDLNSGSLNIDLAIRTAREVGKVLGSLPIVGYILFGKDKSMTTGVKITGTLEKPKAKTNPVQEALLFPLELIKRTITSPAHIIND